MKAKWEVIYTARSIYDGMEPAPYGEHPHERPPRTQHRTWFGADWYRRFRFRPMTLGQRWVETAIVRAHEAVEWSDPVVQADAPPYAALTERVWPALYWLRSRWDGLRYGLDGDKRP